MSQDEEKPDPGPTRLRAASRLAEEAIEICREEGLTERDVLFVIQLAYHAQFSFVPDLHYQMARRPG